MPTPYDPEWDRAEREQIQREEEMWEARVARRQGPRGRAARRIGALFLVLLLLWIYVIRYLI